jgi:5-methylcytosine-specific restriction protein A
MLQLQREPRCQWVENGERCEAEATEVDHVTERQDGGTDATSNLASLCVPHHRLKTARERQRRATAVRTAERDMERRYGRRAPS